MTQAAGATKPLSLVAGSGELPLLRKQTADFAGHRAKYGLPVTYEEIPGADHFTVMNEMLSSTGSDHDADPAIVREDGELVPSFRDASEASKRTPKIEIPGRCYGSPRNDEGWLLRSPRNDG